MSDRRNKRTVVSKEGRYLGLRHVMYCTATKMYVSADCMNTTPSRMWAWSGTPSQSRGARAMFGIGDEFELFLDGEEKSDG